MTPDALERLESSPSEIQDLFRRYEIALADARVDGQSAEGRYVDAYTAGFLLAKIVVRASGHRVKGGENHRDTLRVLPWLMGSAVDSITSTLDTARKQRNASLYDSVGLVDDHDVAALIDRVVDFEAQVRAWLAGEHPELAS